MFSPLLFTWKTIKEEVLAKGHRGERLREDKKEKLDKITLDSL